MPAATRSRWCGTPAAPPRSASATSGRSTATWPRSAVVSRSGWCWSTSSPGRTRCCCSTSRTTSSTYPARSGSRPGSGSRPRRSCSSATTGSCWPTRRPGWSPSSSAPRATPCGRTPAGSSRTTRRGGTGSLGSRSCAGAGTRSTPKLKALVLRYKIKAEYNAGLASQYSAAQTRLRKFEEAGPPVAQPREQQVKMRLKGGRTGKRAVVCEELEMLLPAVDSDLAVEMMKPFDLEVWYGERVAVLGSNGSGKSHFLRLLAAGGSDPDVEHRPVGDTPVAPVRHTGRAKLGARVRPGLVRADPRTSRADGPHAAGDPPSRRRPPRRDAARTCVAGAGPLRAGARRRPALRVALRWPAGAVPDPAAGAVRRHPAAARRADRQPRRGVGGGAGGGSRASSRAPSSR